MPKIHYITPYSLERNFGKAINEECELIPNNDWICVLDGDMLFLTPDWGRIINEVVEAKGNEFQLFGCLTNRLARPIQRYKGEFSNNHDILHHYVISENILKNGNIQVKDITSTRLVAGMFMLFSKRTWLKHRFEENTHHFDDRFSKSIVKSGGRLGLVESIYAYHFYRGWSDNPTHALEHLK